jgi:hypothetical protein
MTRKETYRRLAMLWAVNAALYAFVCWPMFIISVAVGAYCHRTYLKS